MRVLQHELVRRGNRRVSLLAEVDTACLLGPGDERLVVVVLLLRPNSAAGDPRFLPEVDNAQAKDLAEAALTPALR